MKYLFGQRYGKPGSFDHFSEGTGYTSCFFIFSAGTNLKGAFKLSSLYSTLFQARAIRAGHIIPYLWEDADNVSLLALIVILGNFYLQVKKSKHFTSWFVSQ